MKNAFCYETMIGKIVIIENGTAITHAYLGEDIPNGVDIIETSLLKQAKNELIEYLDGKRKKFNISLEPNGTEFQQKVWNSLKEIPYGKTYSYKDIAENIGNVKACRAVGMANNKNPIMIFIPCHRVIGSNGKLVGYAGGLDMKEKLLQIEKQNIDKLS
ncbi:methylated-DNA--protein-cysteinemethyltransferase Ogt [Gottschalkia acidurici 9a]|uniref:Methylated-DNA--protein-cysteine methyltransferase n=1 Tax=Gottschalkia acidurici (strain ATCC 7906 / DSM 604 / BCRC 14475 / CIP 104303 / KCTC 5404 / NCIMB 10678 / 9a) TaxID=1128398 RepID=K0AYG2_GOTA9|nr:methylated-DNA--[protein]-cysteine S-methyltransferase [Gottschalkia acidurici]AFS77411.1 methylated-DNA--protein-cysteinemethyltransferase Ogt [Gottschalkia acidurici 9a]